MGLGIHRHGHGIIFYSSNGNLWLSQLVFFSSLKHFGHFFYWDISVICVTVVSKLAVKVFISLYFQTFWPKWLDFFRSFQKRFGPWPKKRNQAPAHTIPTKLEIRSTLYHVRIWCLVSSEPGLKHPKSSILELEIWVTHIFVTKYGSTSLFSWAAHHCAVALNLYV